VTLIDDALSAVDAHVAAELFEKALIGELMATDETANKRSVVLVTNAIQYLNHPRVNRIVVLQEGQVVEEGTYKQLAAKEDSVFARFLSVLSETGVSKSLTEGSSPEIRRTSLTIKTENAPEGSDIHKPSKTLMTEETRMKGNVNVSVYLSWFRAAGHIIWVPVAVIVAQAMGEVAQVLSNWWLTYWSAHGESQSERHLLSIYAIINLAAALVGLLRNFLLAYFGLRASRQVCHR
jgi:ATP-binding cassette, subfamily C (CFTR/MRP), member 1